MNLKLHDSEKHLLEQQLASLLGLLNYHPFKWYYDLCVHEIFSYLILTFKLG